MIWSDAKSNNSPGSFRRPPWEGEPQGSKGTTPQPAPGPMPYYVPPYYIPPTSTTGPPMDVVDKLLPQVPFNHRPAAYKIAIILICIGVGLCLIFASYLLIDLYVTFFTIIFISLFLIIGILGIISVTFLLIPRKVGWYLGVITGFLGLSGLGIGTLIAIFAIVCLFWPSVRYYFHTGHYPPPLFFMPTYYPPYNPYPHQSFQHPALQTPNEPRKNTKHP